MKIYLLNFSDSLDIFIYSRTSVVVTKSELQKGTLSSTKMHGLNGVNLEQRKRLEPYKF